MVLAKWGLLASSPNFQELFECLDLVLRFGLKLGLGCVRVHACMCVCVYVKTFSVASVIFLATLSSFPFAFFTSASVLLLRGRTPTHFSAVLQSGAPSGGHRLLPSHCTGVQVSERTLPHT